MDRSKKNLARTLQTLPGMLTANLLILTGTFLLCSACVAQGKYDAKVAEVGQLQGELAAARRDRAAGDEVAKSLSERLDKAQAALQVAEKSAAQLKDTIAEADRHASELEETLNERHAAVTGLQQQLESQKQLLAEFESLAKAYGAQSPEGLKRALADLQQKVHQTEQALKRAAGELERERRLSSKLASLIDAGKLRVRRRNGRLVIELPGDIHFASGSAKLTDVGRDTLKRLAQVLKAEQDRLFVVEGHTDNVPIAVSGFRNNWHLGAARAEFAREALVDAGLNPHRVAIASWADVMPACPQVNQPACRKRNRRVEVVLLPRFE